MASTIVTSGSRAKERISVPSYSWIVCAARATKVSGTIYSPSAHRKLSLTPFLGFNRFSLKGKVCYFSFWFTNGGSEMEVLCESVPAPSPAPAPEPYVPQPAPGRVEVPITERPKNGIEFGWAMTGDSGDGDPEPSPTVPQPQPMRRDAPPRISSCGRSAEYLLAPEEDESAPESSREPREPVVPQPEPMRKNG